MISRAAQYCLAARAIDEPIRPTPMIAIRSKTDVPIATLVTMLHQLYHLGNGGSARSKSNTSPIPNRDPHLAPQRSERRLSADA